MSVPVALPDLTSGINSKNRTNRLPLRMMLVLLLIVGIAEMVAIVRITDVSDYQTHILIAENAPQINFSYPLYHYIAYGLDALLPFASIFATGVFTAVIAYLVLAAVIATSLHRQMRGRHPWTAVFLTLGLIFSAPILIVSLESGRYFGYQHPMTYQSPTTAMLRPFALVVFLYTAYAFLPPVATWPQIGLATVVAGLMNFAKPNYGLAVLPVTGLMMVYHWVRRLFVDTKILIFVLGAITLVLALQFLGDFGGQQGGGIAFRPLYILMDIRKMTLEDILIKQFLSFVFPLVVLILYWNQARRDTLLMLAWGGFLVGRVCALALVDVLLAADNNFYWTGEITLFILFFSTVHFWLRQMNGRFDLSTRRSQIVMVIWSLHLISGIFWYVLQLDRSYYH